MNDTSSLFEQFQTLSRKGQCIKLIRNASTKELIVFLKNSDQVEYQTAVAARRQQLQHRRLIANYGELNYPLAHQLLKKAYPERQQDKPTLFECVARNTSLSKQTARKLSRDGLRWEKTEDPTGQTHKNQAVQKQGTHLLDTLVQHGYSLAPEVREALAEELPDRDNPDTTVEWLILDLETSSEQLQACAHTLKQDISSEDLYKRWRGLLIHPNASSATRKEAAQFLGEVRGFLELLYDTNFRMSDSVFALFLEHGKPRSLKRFLQGATSNIPPSKLRGAWQALGQQSGQEAFRVLQKLLKEEQGNPRLLDALNKEDFQPLLGHENQKIRQQTLRLLAQTSSPPTRKQENRKGPVRS